MIKNFNERIKKIIRPPSTNIPNVIIYFLIGIATILSIIFYFFPFQNAFNQELSVSKVYFADNITDAHLQLINIFNEKYRGEIEVIPIDLPTEKFTTNKRKELITRTLRSRNSRIDLFAVDQIWIPRFTKWAEPLDEYFSKSELQTIIPKAFETSVFDSTLFAIPFFIDVGVLFYRQDLIDRIPNSKKLETKLKNGIELEELIQLQKQYFPNQFIYLFQGDAYEGLICNYLETLGGNGGNIYADRKFNVFNPKAISSAQQLVDLIYKYKITPRIVAEFDESKSIDYALRHDIPFFRGWPTAIKYSNLVSKVTGKLKYLKTAALPKNSFGNSVSTLGGWNIILSRFSTVKKEAVTFIKFILSEEAQEINYRMGAYLPIIKSFYSEDRSQQKYPELNDFGKLINSGLLRPFDYNYTKISDVLSMYLNKTLKNELEVSAALKEAQEQIDIIVNAYPNNSNNSNGEK